jgi:5-methylthioadenosine/S-adenosylhomocysteine deaminase
VGSVFGGKFGAVAQGQTADLVLLDAVEAGSQLGWERLAIAPVAWTIVGGRVVVREGQLLGADFTALAADAARAVEAIWARA